MSNRLSKVVSHWRVVYVCVFCWMSGGAEVAQRHVWRCSVDQVVWQAGSALCDAAEAVQRQSSSAHLLTGDVLTAHSPFSMPWQLWNNSTVQFNPFLSTLSVDVIYSHVSADWMRELFILSPVPSLFISSNFALLISDYINTHLCFYSGSWWRNVWNIRLKAPDQEVDQRGHGERLCKKIGKHVIWTRRMLWIVIDGRSW